MTTHAVRTRLITMACDNCKIGVRFGAHATGEVRTPTPIGLAGWLIRSYILTATSINYL